MDSLSLDLPEATSVDLRGQVVPLGPAGGDRQVIVLAGRDLLAAGVFVWNGIREPGHSPFSRPRYTRRPSGPSQELTPACA